MTYKTYEDARTMIAAHHQNGEYAKAMSILDSIRPQFPDDQVDIDYFRACIAVRLENTPLTYQILDDLLANGIWFSEDLFRMSPSLALLQGKPEFEQRIKSHAELRAQSGDAYAPILHIRTPAGGGLLPVIFHLHGNGSGALNEIEHWQAAVDAGWLVAAPNSSRTFWAGGGSFWPDHETARTEIIKQLTDLRARHKLDKNNLIFSGFSMGGDIALAETLKGELAPARGFLLVGPGGPITDEPESLKPLIETAKARNLRGAILISESDSAIQGEKLEEVVNLLNAGGILTKFEKYPDIGHVYPSDFGARLSDLLGWITGNHS
ncbi:MAG TPA: hypothetical protein VI451_18890 [Anaerolineales bacterium]|nr:hypothetical protein [Anaerolineales bacterium]